VTTRLRHTLGWPAAGLLGLAVALSAGPAARASEEALESSPPAEIQPTAEAQEVQPGAVVHLEFTLRDESGALQDDNRGRPPLVFTHGTGEVIPGLERALTGMKAGETKRITVPPEEGYGPVDPAAITEVPKARVPAEALVVGARLSGQTRSGREVPVRVREIRDGTVVLDLNHPLAGKTLVFEVRVILVEPP
jgi:FKBP-type peptidyl-prolyl cis-trans isomerase 2